MYRFLNKQIMCAYTWNVLQLLTHIMRVTFVTHIHRYILPKKKKKWIKIRHIVQHVLEHVYMQQNYISIKVRLGNHVNSFVWYRITYPWHDHTPFYVNAIIHWCFNIHTTGGTARWLQLQPSSAWPRRRKRSKMFSLCTSRITARSFWDSSGF